MLSRLELQCFQKNCFDAAFQCVRYADLENYLLGERNKESVVGRIESAINWLTDIDWMWWPLLSLRPKRTDRCKGSRLKKTGLAIIPFFGSN